jgi:hypothetical protein
MLILRQKSCLKLVKMQKIINKIEGLFKIPFWHVILFSLLFLTIALNSVLGVIKAETITEKFFQGFYYIHNIDYPRILIQCVVVPFIFFSLVWIILKKINNKQTKENDYLMVLFQLYIYNLLAGAITMLILAFVH